MVKKRVVRRHSSKSMPKGNKNVVKHVEEKHKRRHHAIIRSLAVAKAKHIRSEKSKAENLELQANIAVMDQKIVTSETLENKVEIVEEQKPTVVVEEPKKIIPEPKPVIIEPKIMVSQSISGDDLKGDLPVVKDGERNSRHIRITVFLIAIFLLGFWSILIMMSIETSVDKTFESHTTVTINEPVDLSIERYVKNASSYIGPISMIGYLREELIGDEMLGERHYYIIDEDNNRVELSLDATEVAAYDLKFVAGETSKDTYNVSGIYRYLDYEYTLDVTSIERQDRPMHEVEVDKLENVTIKVPGFKINISNGWNKLIGKR